jgi:hypothetical protein
MKILGLITSTIHSTRRYAQEIRNNLNLLRAACIAAVNPKFHSTLGLFVNKIQSEKRVVSSSLSKGEDQVKFRCEDKNANDLAIVQTALRQENIKLYRSCYISTVRFTTVSYKKSGQSNDSCVLFFLAGEPAVGFITNVILIDSQQVLFRIRRVSINDKLYVYMKNSRITCSTVFYGNINDGSCFMYVQPQSII